LASSPDELETIISEISNMNNLDANKIFNSYRTEHLNAEFNYLLYCVPNKNSEKINSLFSIDLKNISEPFKNLGHYSMQGINVSNGLKVRLHLMHQSENAESTSNTLWACKLDTACNLKPYSFLNHKTNENEISVQDLKNNLYLINAKGKILWKNKINEKIISPIYMVDAFNNHKNQMLFNTKNYLHLIDRNGNYVQGFPYKLQAETKAPLSLFDYKGDGEYRIFISCTNHFIYNYNIMAEEVDGFEPVKTENDIFMPLKYNSISGGDYLTAIDCEGKIYIFGRKGQSKINLKNRCIQNCKSFEMYTSNSLATNYIIYYDDKNSLINKIFLIDKKDVVKLNIEPNADYNQFGLIDGNRDNDLMVLKEKQFLAFNFSGDLLATLDLSSVSSEVLHFENEDKNAIAVINKEKMILEFVDLISKKRKTLNANTLPLILNLFNDNKNYLVVPNGNYIKCEPLN
jgi:hypothetical protein